MTAVDRASLRARRAIEALRAGVPNRDAVSALGFDAPRILEAFDTAVSQLPTTFDSETQVEGLLIAGEFGAGKSHALEYLTDRALGSNLAVSKVVISKETQLFDAGKVYRAAVDTMQIPGRTGDALDEIALSKLDYRSQQFADFRRWLDRAELNSRFAATAWLYENSGAASPELNNRLVTFWSGGPLAVSQLRQDLRSLGAVQTFPLEKCTAKELARQRFSFLAHLLRAAGFNGWLILLDEIELIGRYSILQRGRSYAELARLLGMAKDEQMPGLLAVGAITPDFSSAIIRGGGGGKDDINQIRFKFQARGKAEDLLSASLAERAMDAIERRLHLIPEPDHDRLERTLGDLAEVYATAYEQRPRPAGELTRRPMWQMRQYVRGWINSWDLERIDPTYEPDVEVHRLVTEYTEDEVLERSPDEEESGAEASEET